MKKYISYVLVLALGLILGAFLFGKSSETDREHSHEKAENNSEMWTCSMHPQIMQPEAGNCPICGMDLIPTVTSTEGLQANEFQALLFSAPGFCGWSMTRDPTHKKDCRIVSAS